MKIIPNAKKVLRSAWSMWAAYVAVLFGVLDAAQPGLAALLPELQSQIPDSLYRVIALVCGLLVPLLRVVDQGIAGGQQAAKSPQ